MTRTAFPGLTFQLKTQNPPQSFEEIPSRETGLFATGNGNISQEPNTEMLFTSKLYYTIKQEKGTKTRKHAPTQGNQVEPSNIP